MYGKFKYIPVIQDVDKNLKRISNKLELMLNETFITLNKTKDIMEKHYYNSNSNFVSYSVLWPCTTNLELNEFEFLNEMEKNKSLSPNSLDVINGNTYYNIFNL